ncbi:MAG: CcmD family protein [Bacteroidota bacterium]|nr:CcmD family protein [Bacteroidota bacterium]MEC8221714.1 CcmD family protein [Bacteroidota bacterium]|tara:strand:+ start:140 stop:316 length:177 start_codon:yes stop_codon:yes gene_type:complete
MNFLFFLFLILQEVAMADAMRSNGKIYVVVVISLIILFSLFLYLYRIEKQIKSIKKNK